MAIHSRTLAASLVLGFLLAGPAEAKRKQAPHRQAASAAASTASAADARVRAAGYALPAESRPSAGTALAAPGEIRSTRSNRARVTETAGADFWAHLPDLSLSYRAGKRGPVIELGAFGFDLRPLPGDRTILEDEPIAHLSFAWNF